MGSPVRPYPAFAWSESRDRRFRECRRKHFLAVYLSHNGWLPDAPAARRLAWALSRAVPSWHVALGTAIHRQVLVCARTCAATGALPPQAVIRNAVRDELNQLHQRTQHGVSAFWRAPRRSPVLADALYGVAPSSEIMDAVRARLEDAVAALVASKDLWDVVRRAGVNGVIGPDPWTSFILGPDNLTVFAAPDLVLRLSEEPAQVWEFKTGRVGDVVDTVLLYALSARECLGIPWFPHAASRYAGRVIRLATSAPAEERAPFAISDHDFEITTARIRESVSAMQALLRDVGQNIPQGIHAFPRTERRWRCGTCVYRGLCEPTTYPLRGVPPVASLAGDTECLAT